MTPSPRAGAWMPPLVVATLLVLVATPAAGHPLGNFSTNHYARVRVSPNEITIHYVVEMAEITTFQEIAAATGGRSGAWSDAERDAYLSRVTARYADGLALTRDGARVVLRVRSTALDMPAGAAGQPTLRVTSDVAGTIDGLAAPARFVFEDTNHRGRAGWHELVVEAGTGVEIFASTAFADGVSDELRRYPREVLMAPLQERAAAWSAIAGPLPAGAARPASRPPLHAAPPLRARVAALLQPPGFSAAAACAGVLLAFTLGSLQSRAFPAPSGSGRLRSLRLVMAEMSQVVPVAAVALIVAEHLLPARWQPVVGVVAGGVVGLLGASLLMRRWRLSCTPPLAILVAGVAVHHVGFGFALLAAYGLGRLAASIVGSAVAGGRTPTAAPGAAVAQALVMIAAGVALGVGA